MRLWSIHPKYLDKSGLGAVWREGLLAQAVLLGNTKGYKNHSQLERFKASDTPISAIGTYLKCVVEEANGTRKYKYDNTKIYNDRFIGKILVTKGQIEYEFIHLMLKLEKRDPDRYARLCGMNIEEIELHPMFCLIDGDVEPWEKV